jgi:hypothetical protein
VHLFVCELLMCERQQPVFSIPDEGHVDIP